MKLIVEVNFVLPMSLASVQYLPLVTVGEAVGALAKVTMPNSASTVYEFPVVAPPPRTSAVV